MLFVGEYMWVDFWFDQWVLLIRSNHRSIEEAREALADHQKRGENDWISAVGTQPVAKDEPEGHTDPDQSIVPNVGYLALHPPVDNSVLNSAWFFRTFKYNSNVYRLLHFAKKVLLEAQKEEPVPYLGNYQARAAGRSTSEVRIGKGRAGLNPARFHIGIIS